ncbi:MAG: DedA family protein [Thermosulfidibacteraceae bacterium]|jgi:membrane protein DedA with SNARE-associated domain
MVESLATIAVNTIEELGYVGIFILMLIESTFFPLPSEVVLTPAGYLISKGKLDPFLVVLSSGIGSLAGSLLTYYLGLFVGRPLVVKYGKYIFFDYRKLEKAEKFFNKYGSLSIFIGRLLLGVRHYISFPAGMAKMNLYKFSLFTFLGASLWSIILILMGFYVGENEKIVKKYSHEISLTIIAAIIAFIAIKLFSSKRVNNS